MSIRDVLKSRGAYSEVVDRVYAVWRRRLLATALGIAVPLLHFLCRFPSRCSAGSISAFPLDFMLLAYISRSCVHLYFCPDAGILLFADRPLAWCLILA